MTILTGCRIRRREPNPSAMRKPMASQSAAPDEHSRSKTTLHDADPYSRGSIWGAVAVSGDAELLSIGHRTVSHSPRASFPNGHTANSKKTKLISVKSYGTPFPEVLTNPESQVGPTILMSDWA
jgi:hypothetical protein